MTGQTEPVLRCHQVILNSCSSLLSHCGNSSSSSFSSLVLLPWQSVVCGHGTRYRNLSCFVSDGSSDGEGSQVDEELCSSLELEVDGDKHITLKEACILPCPGNNAVPTVVFLSFLMHGQPFEVIDIADFPWQPCLNVMDAIVRGLADMFTLSVCICPYPTINCAALR